MKRREMDTTSSNTVYRKARKLFLEMKGLIVCGYCKYHKNENLSGDTWNHRSWKRHRKTQYRN